MTRKNGVAVLQTRIEKELREIKKVVERVEKNLADISPKTPEDIVVVGFAGYVHSFYNGLERVFDLIAEYIHSYSFDLDWDELKPKAENLKPTFEKLEAAFQQFFAFLQAASAQID